MNRDMASVDIHDDEIWKQRRDRLIALESVNGTPRQVEFKFLMNQQLQAFAEKGDVDKFIESLEECSAKEGVSLSNILDMRGPSGNSLLHVAAGIMKADILRALLEVSHVKQLATEVNFRGDTALHVAARAGSIHTAKHFLDYTAKHLLDYGNILDMANDAGNTALHEAVKKGNYELTDLLRQSSKSVNKKNKESKCPLYLAVEMGDLKSLKLLMEPVAWHEVLPSGIEGISPVHGAVIHKRKEMLEEMSKSKKELFCLRDARGGTPLHLAASMNYVAGVEFLINEFSLSAFEGDEEGYLPIHIACKMGHIEIIKKLLQLWKNPDELVTLKEGQNILHVAAKYGQKSVVCSILYSLKFEKLVNAKDKEGNTPLHVAAFQLQSLSLLTLISDDIVDLEILNNDNLTAFDIVHEQLKKFDAPLKVIQLRAVLVLEAVKAPRSKDKAVCGLKDLDPGKDEEHSYIKKLKEVANHRMLVATLVATMTFAAGFSVPGGYNDSEPNAGIATLLNKPMYSVFVICNTVAMYSSIMAAVILLGGQISYNSNKVVGAIGKARQPLLIALITMSMAFMAGVYVTTNKFPRVANVALIVGIASLLHTVKVHCYFFSWTCFHFLVFMAPLKRRWIRRRRRLSRNPRRS